MYILHYVLKHLKKNCVLVPIDKAPNNVPIICKRYYVEVILNKISLSRHGNNTNCKADKLLSIEKNNE